MPHEAAEPVRIEDAVVLIRISQRYRPGMSERELYEATRGIWRLSPKNAGRASYALAVHKGAVKEAYEIAEWHPAGTLEYETRDLNLNAKREGRWEFEGQVAPDAVRERYVGWSVADYFRKGAANPIRYVNC